MPLPSFILTDSEGTPRSFPTGRHTLLIFWWSECPTCRLSLPVIAAACRTYSGQLELWLIAQEPSTDLQALRTGEFTCPILDDGLLQTSWRFGIDAVPTIILADPQGEELIRFVGFTPGHWDELFAEAARLTGATPPSLDWSSYPAWRPGCGPRNFLPETYERLAAALGPFQPPPGGNAR